MSEENKKEEKIGSSDVLDNIIASESKVDRILTGVKNILKKHWGILILLGIAYFIYWAFNLPQEKPKQQEVKQDVWTYELSEQGDTIWYLNDTLYENK